MPGYEVTPIEPLNAGLICRECGLLLREAVQTEEGDRLCRTCYEEVKKTGISKDGITLDGGECYPDRAANKEVLQLLVKCASYHSGCTWEGKLRDVEGHIQSDCQYQPQQCSNDGCEAVLLKLQLEHHVKNECQYRSVHCEPCRQNGASGGSQALRNLQTNCKLASTKQPSVHTVMAEVQSLRRVVEETDTLLDVQESQCATVADKISKTEEQSEGLFSDVVQLKKKVKCLEKQNAELKLQLQASLSSTYNGSFLWRIPDIARKRKDALEERITSIDSPPFYTGRNGYKMCVRAYLNGDGIGYRTHFSLFFVLMRGEYDPLLKWPFDYKVSLILVDQDHRKPIVQTFKPTPGSSSFKQPTSHMNAASGCPQFAKIRVLEDPSYVKDDTMYVKCIVDVSMIYHP